MNYEKLDSRQMQLLMTDILICFSEYCKENNLRYTLCYGTLLGAVRHKGFIPWDDDIDVMMPREDFERFHKLIQIKHLKPMYRVESIRLGNSPYPFAKIIDTRTKIISKDNTCLMNNLWIDVFPIDGVPEMKEKELKRQIRKLGKWAFLLENACCKFGSGKTKLRKVVKFFVIAYAKVKGAYYYGHKIDAFAQRYSIEDCPYAADMVWGGLKYYSDKSSYLEYVDLEFEGNKFMSPKTWHENLVRVYGDYMELPPKERRITHNVEAVFYK